MMQSIHFLLSPDQTKYSPSSAYFDVVSLCMRNQYNIPHFNLNNQYVSDDNVGHYFLADIIFQCLDIMFQIN